MTEKPRDPRGRKRMPFNEDVADEICERLIEGESLNKICKDDHIPSCTTIFKWLDEFPLFARKYARAHELQADTLVNRALEIANTPEIGETVEIITGPDGVTEKVKRGDMIQHRRLQYDAIRWYAGKVRPKKWGEVKSDEGDSGTIKIEGGLPDD